MAEEMAFYKLGRGEIEVSMLDRVKKEIEMVNISERNSKLKALEWLRETCGELMGEAKRNMARNEELTAILKSTETCLHDPHERCRESATNILQDIVDGELMIEDLLALVMPTLINRLSSKNLVSVEPSEEVRLSSLVLLKSALLKSSSSAYTEDTVSILVHTLSDPFHEIKKESCHCIIQLVAHSHMEFYQHSETLVQPLLDSCLTHQHSKVRIAAIKALGALVSYGASKSIETCYNHLARRMLDEMSQVRIAVTQVAGEWMLTLRDRYSYFGYLIPLILSSTSDEFPDVNQLGHCYWNRIGKQYEIENETEFNDQLEILKPLIECYPNHEVRPTLGCRILVIRNLSAILSGVTNDLRDWQEPVRIKAARLLYRLLINAEEGAVHQVPRILDVLAWGCLDGCQEVVLEIVRTAELVGLLVSSDIWWPIVSAKMMENETTSSQIMVLAALIGGCQESDLKSNIQDIGTFLLQCNLFYSPKTHQDRLQECVKRIIQKKECCEVILFEIFKILMALLSVKEDNISDDGINGQLLDLSKIANVLTTGELFMQFSEKILSEIKESSIDAWTASTEEFCILNTVLKKFGHHSATFLEEALPILIEISKPDRDHEMRFQHLRTLSRIVSKFKDLPENPEIFILGAIKDIILPNTIWHPGKTASTLRAAALSCLWITITNCQLSLNQVKTVFDDVIERTIGSIEDDNKTTRLMSCQILNFLLENYSHLISSQSHVIVTDQLLKRMDDASKDVRLVATRGIGISVTSWVQQKSYDAGIDQHHLKKICQSLLVYLDDTDAEVRDGALVTLEKVASHHSALLKEELEKVKNKHLNQYHVQKLGKLIEALQISPNSS